MQPTKSTSLSALDAPPQPRARRTWRGVLARLLILGSCAALAAAIMAWSQGWRPWAVAEPIASKPAPRPRPPATLAPRDLFAEEARRAARGVVAIQTVGQANARTLGAGFIVSNDGLVATNYHVVSTATAAQVRLPDGRTYGVRGYAAVDRAHDLALLRLEAPPDDLPVLALGDFATEVKPAAAIMAIGHPRGVEFSLFDGRLSRWVLSRELDDDGRRFVRKLTESDENVCWLQHTAALAEGNSGGPLIDTHGRVVGINTWINRAGNLNFAVDVRYLRELLKQTDQPLTPLEHLARSDVQASVIISRISAERVEELLRQVEALQWLPADEAQYRAFSELSLAIVASHLPESFAGDKADGERFHKLQMTVARIEAKLKNEHKLGTPEQITIVNEQASALVSEAHRGVFFFGEVERVVTGSQGQRGLLMKLIGTRQMLFLSLDGQFLDPAPGAIFGVFAANLQGEVVRYGENPLQLISAPVLVSRTFVPVSP
ncbi:MAG TPA: trypsin-like peptidase domain-containing protein [Pirellulaceae bacterium]|nr:trypsin-like peptidase domain-containing protein [Pirellulaceae bacterium]